MSGLEGGEEDPVSVDSSDDVSEAASSIDWHGGGVTLSLLMFFNVRFISASEMRDEVAPVDGATCGCSPVGAWMCLTRSVDCLVSDVVLGGTGGGTCGRCVRYPLIGCRCGQVTWGGMTSGGG